jgi:hypothetical protein
MLPPADINEIAPGLWRWTAKHPEWVAGAKPGSAQEWPREVASVAYDSPGGLVVIDPLVPEGGEGLWAWLDERVAAASGRVWALTTIKWHRRSRDAVAERYAASTSRAKGSLPEGVEPVRIQGCGETMFWLAEPRALVCGDALVGDGKGGLRMCPESWLAYLDGQVTHRELRAGLEPLLELDAQRVLVSHWDPVMRGGAEAIRKAIA